jgi:uncharacterized delta-60 repeat protein
MRMIEGLESRRLLATGEAIPTFGVGGLVEIPFDNDRFPSVVMDVLPDGKFVVVHAYDKTPFGAQSTIDVTRYTADGKVDTTFGGSGGAPAGTSRVQFNQRIIIRDMEVDGQGRFVLAGGTNYGMSVIRLTSAGGVDTSFGGAARGMPSGTPAGLAGGRVNGEQLFGVAGNLALAPDGRIGIVGNAEDNNSAIAVFNPDGSRVAALNKVVEPAYTIYEERHWGATTAGAFISGGDFLVAGYSAFLDYFDQRHGQEQFLRQFNADGTVEKEWPTTGGVDDFAVGGDGKVYAYGDFRVTRYTSGGAIDESFGRDGVAAVAGEHFARLSDGRFYGFDAGRAVSLNRYTASGGSDSTFPSFYMPGGESQQVGGVEVIGGDDALIMGFAPGADNAIVQTVQIRRIEGTPGVEWPTATRNSKGTLQVRGTSAADTIRVSLRTRDNRIVVRVNGEALVRSFPPGPVKRIQIFAGAGADTITIVPGVPQKAYVEGAAGDDTITSGDGYDYLTGGEGNDQISGGGGGDAIFGDGGNDQLFGNGGRDVLHGGDGDDGLFGGPTNADRIFGDVGHDSAAQDAADTYESVEEMLS